MNVPQKKPRSRDYFAELYVAGMLGDCGWSIYFPKRDVGFDFIMSKQTERGVILRPVQVKGKYPSEGKLNKKAYGYIGKLSQIHPEMVLVIPFFPTDCLGAAPVCTAYLPLWRIRRMTDNRWACQPASLVDGITIPRKNYRGFFDAVGIAAIESSDWSRNRAE